MHHGEKQHPVATVLEYHQGSKHRPERIAPGPGRLDWVNQPDPFRRFENAPHIPLPFGADRLNTRFSRVRAGEGLEAAPIDLTNMAVLLELSMGLSAWKRYGPHTWSLRCNPSSGNLHPTECYLVSPNCDDLAAGVYHYVPEDHAIEQRLAPSGEPWDAIFEGGFLVGLTSIYWREAWKYGMRAWRYCQHDLGHAMGALRYAAGALGWGAHLLDGFGDDQIAHILGVDRAGEFQPQEREQPQALLWVGPGRRTPDPEALLTAVDRGRWQGCANRLSNQHVDWLDIQRIHHATYKPPTPPLPTPASTDLPPLASPLKDFSAASLYRQRRSAVAFDASTATTRDNLFNMLDALLRRPGAPPWDTLPWAPQVHPFVFVHRVDGLDPGLYMLLRDGTAMDKLRHHTRSEWLWDKAPGSPPHLHLYLLLPTDLRQTAELVSCQQTIAGDSSFSLGMLAPLEPALERGTWWYRYLYWEAGLLGHTLYLEAEAAGLQATGIGCFFDDEIHRILGIDSRQWQSLYHFTVGGGVNDERLMTLPPYDHLPERSPNSL